MPAYSDQISDMKVLAEQGDANSQFFLGLAYDSGRGVPQDRTEAAKWYLLAAEQGAAGAQNNLALLYANGWGVPRNYLLAHMWCNYAVGNGVEEAIELLLSLEDDMTPEQIEEAKRMLNERIAARRSAENLN